jgi:pimeloyl-ACP methyl ester carboxylesterase
LIADAYIFDPEIDNYELEALAVPTLFVHARDDLLVSYDLAQRAAARVPGAQLVTIQRGGHLMLGGHGEFVASSVFGFLTAQACSPLVDTSAASFGPSPPRQDL